MRRLWLVVGLLAGCANITPQPADPKVVQRIENVCMASGYFKFVNGALALAYPPAAVPAQIFNRGIDQVCGDPVKFAGDVSTVEWLVRNMPWKQVS